MTVKTSFGKFADVWDGKVGDKGVVSSQETVKATLKLLGSIRGKNIYEVACGNGFLARKLIRGGAKEVYASDISQELIDIAKTRYDVHNIIYSTREAIDFKKLPKNYFDAVVIHQGIFYIKNINSLMQGVASILKQNGVIIFTIQHPLSHVSKRDIGIKSATGEPIDLIKEGRRYLNNYGKVMHNKWLVRGKTSEVTYFIYCRPMSYYINMAGKHGLFVQSIVESKSQALIRGKLKKSNIPGSLIIKAVKV